ncbi:MAG: 50S ribosomal protein L9 [Anaerolineaceae bacterium]|nr:50S ribosomal protein L9 [Anaerolineaceae bacterium]
MKVLLLKDIYKLGRAGDIKKVADGYGRNYLLPQGLAVLATPGAVKQVKYIQEKASQSRAQLNNEMSSVADKITGAVLYFASKAGETGKLYGSITTQMIAEALSDKFAVTVDRREIECEPIRVLGEHKAHVRLTIDLIPEVQIIVHREGEKLEAIKSTEEVPASEETKNTLEEALVVDKAQLSEDEKVSEEPVE